MIAMHNKGSNSRTKFSKTTATTAPIAIGTQGTIGSLVKKEIEHFTKFELDLNATSSRKPAGEQVIDIDSPRHSSSKSSLWLLIMTWKKKQRGSKRFLSSICSAVEVAERNRLFSYRILEDDAQNLNTY